MLSRAEFRARVTSQRTVWMAGAYDAYSARMIEAAGFEGVMTSGYGVSASHLGMPDAEYYTMTENLSVVRHAVNAVSIPLVADIDTGYGNPLNVMRTVREFEAAGVAAVILEDQVAPKRCPICTGGIEVIGLEEGVAKIAAACDARRDPSLVIVARTDAQDPAEAMRRASAYARAGADLVQPISRTFGDIAGLRAFREAAGVPLSLQMLGWLEKLAPEEVESVAGMATFALVPLMTVAQALRENLAVLARDRSAAALPRPVMANADFSRDIGFDEVERLQLRYLARA